MGARSTVAVAVAIDPATGFAVSSAPNLDPSAPSQPHPEALHDVATAVNRAHDLRDLLPILAAATADAVAADRVGVFVFDAEGERIVAHHFHGVDEADAARRIILSRRGMALFPVERRLLTDGVVRANDELAEIENPYPGAVYALVPLSARGSVLGCLWLCRNDGERLFGDPDRVLLAAIGALGGVAVERAKIAEAMRRYADHLELLNQIGRALSGTIEVDALCRVIHEQVARVLKVDACYVALWDETADEVWFPYMYDDGERIPGERLRLNDGPTARVVRTRRSYLKVRPNDPLVLAGTRFGDRGRVSTSAMYVPMLRGERLIGVLSVQRYDPAPYDEGDLRTLEIIAQQASAAVVHAHLHAETVAGRKAAERHAADLEAVLAITKAITSAGDLVAMLDVLSRRLAALVPHDEVGVYRISPDGRRVQSILHRHWDEHQPRDLAPWSFPIDRGLVGQAARGGPAELVNNAHHDPRSYYELDHEAAGRTMGEHAMVAPLLVAERPIGVLFVSRLGTRPFEDHEFARFRLLAEQAAVAIHQAALLEDARAARAGADRHVANLEAVLRTTQAITAQVDVRPTLDTLADHLNRLIRPDRIEVWRVDKENRTTWCRSMVALATIRSARTGWSTWTRGGGRPCDARWGRGAGQRRPGRSRRGLAGRDAAGAPGAARLDRAVDRFDRDHRRDRPRAVE